MSEMQRNKGIVKRISTKENAKEVYEQLLADGRVDNKWDELNEDGSPAYIESQDYELVNGEIFDVSGAPDQYDSDEEVADAERLNETDYRIHAYYYNGGGDLSEMLESMIPKADAEYEKNKKDGFDLTINFPSKEHAEAFAGWLSNSGEQDHYRQMDFEDKDQEYLYRLNYDYTQSSNGLIKAIQIDE